MVSDNLFRLINVEPNKMRERLLEFYKYAIDLKNKYYKVINENHGFRYGGVTLTSQKNFEKMLALKHELGFSIEDIFLSEEEFAKLIKREPYNGTTEKDKEDYYKIKEKKDYLVMCTMSGIKEFESDIEKVIEQYDKNSNSEKSVNDLRNTFLKLSYYSRIYELATNISKEDLNSKSKKLDSEAFLKKLHSNEKYISLKNMYRKINTVEKRNDLNPELYVKNRINDLSGLVAFSDEEIQKITDYERRSFLDWVDNLRISPKDKFKLGIPENQKLEYGWGAILQKPSYYLKDEPVDNPIFSGKITVENLGYFSEQTCFQNNLYERKIRARHVERNPKKSFLGRLFMAKDKTKHETIREYYYMNEPTLELYDNILRVTKTDLQGRIRTDIIFSPVTYNDLEDPEALDFFKNIYCSDYMLDFSKTNGKYAGRLHKNSLGYTILNRWSKDRIASAILFQNGSYGSIIDRRFDKEKIYKNQRCSDFFNLIKEGERERVYE